MFLEENFYSTIVFDQICAWYFGTVLISYAIYAISVTSMSPFDVLL